MAPYTPFIIGELVTLCPPNDHAIDIDGWAEWFNDTARLGATRHGIFPNTPSQQRIRLENMPPNNISLMICDCEATTAFGTISLQMIDMAKREAEISITLGRNPKKRLPRFAALEAMARLTAHGFDEVGLLRIGAGQAAHLLVKWNQQMEMIGYKTEGVLRGAFQRGHTRADVFRIAAHYDHYNRLKSHRNGSLWPGAAEISRIAAQLAETSFAEKVDTVITQLDETHFKYLFD